MIGFRVFSPLCNAKVHGNKKCRNFARHFRNKEEMRAGIGYCKTHAVAALPERKKI